MVQMNSLGSSTVDSEGRLRERHSLVQFLGRVVGVMLSASENRRTLHDGTYGELQPAICSQGGYRDCDNSRIELLQINTAQTLNEYSYLIASTGG